MRRCTANPFATALFLGTVGIWVAIEARQSLRRRAEATQMDRGSAFVLLLLVVAATVLAALAPSITAAALPAGPVTFSFGLCVMWAGIGLRWWSFSTLGRYFTFNVMASPDQPVIAAGPYRVLRHPGYAAILLVLGGMGISYGNWLSLAALLILPFIGLVNRIRVEEAALVATLGPAYATYARSRKRLIPFIW
jgi:protein-S-isoprenylcysteine O-methyltransferase Ste14